MFELYKNIYLLLVILVLNHEANSSLISIDFSRKINSSYINLPEQVSLIGNLKANNKLEKASYIGKGKLIGPECMAFDNNDNLYTGIGNGFIYKINTKNISDITIVTLTGPQTQDFCENKNFMEECGRPFGLRFKENDYENLYVADAFYGILKINLKTGLKTVVIDSKDKRFGGKPMKFTNDLDFDQDTIYFIDTSYERGANDFLFEYLEAQPRGRLFSYNEKTNELNLLLENLYFPNGLQLTPDKNSILINENTMSRILEYFIKGDQKGNTRVFAITPGFGDTIRLTERNTLLVPIGVSRINKLFSVLDLLGKYPTIRNIIVKVLDFGYVLSVIPKYGLIAEYDLKGNPINSWHDPSNKIISSISTGITHKNKLYLGSLLSDFLSVLDLD
ncbi:unnamed protein product [Brachionus calyciflorus]|uniref:Strictosidine synthase conserved region domain-containing protein n=1 Tax=Brachionus calyciflorus TaxID=104777 RepID=A0A814A4G2_9BILA|nr:unnamed protein product [Brachionus calyciflorus]